MNYLTALLEDHKNLRSLMDELKGDELSSKQKHRVFNEFISLLQSHARSEEKTIYLTFKDIEALKEATLEGWQEHLVSDDLIAKIKRTTNPDLWYAKVKVLIDLTRHHLEEEEEELFSKIRDNFPPEFLRSCTEEYLALRGKTQHLVNAHNSGALD